MLHMVKIFISRLLIYTDTCLIRKFLQNKIAQINDFHENLKVIQSCAGGGGFARVFPPPPPPKKLTFRYTDPGMKSKLITCRYRKNPLRIYPQPTYECKLMLMNFGIVKFITIRIITSTGQ